MPTLFEDFSILESLVERQESKPKHVKPERVWSAIKRRFTHHAAVKLQSARDNIRELGGAVHGEQGRAKAIKAMDELMFQYGAIPSVKRTKWEGGKQVIRTYRANGRHIAMLRLREQQGPVVSVWHLQISVPKR
jgi:hypothetical protein